MNQTFKHSHSEAIDSEDHTPTGLKRSPQASIIQGLPNDNTVDDPSAMLSVSENITKHGCDS